MIRKGMINLAIGKDIAGAGSDGTLGTTWMSTPVNSHSSPVAVVRADLGSGSDAITHEVGHVIGFPHVAGLGPGFTPAESYWGFNTTEHGAVFSKIFSCYVSD